MDGSLDEYLLINMMPLMGHADNSEAVLKHETQLSLCYMADPAKNITAGSKEN